MLLNILQGAAKNCLPQNVNSAEAMKPWLRENSANQAKKLAFFYSFFFFNTHLRICLLILEREERGEREREILM